MCFDSSEMLNESPPCLTLASCDGRDGVNKGKGRCDSCAILIRLNFESAPKLPYALPHPAKSHPLVRSKGQGDTLLQWYSSAFIADLNDKQLFFRRPNLDTGRFAS